MLLEHPVDPSVEVDRFLSDSTKGLNSHENYPNIKKLQYTDLNTWTAVERLFSLGGRAFTSMRSRLASTHFEMLVFLRMANSYNIDTQY